MNLMQRLLLTILAASVPIGVLEVVSVRQELVAERAREAQLAAGIAERAAAEQHRVAEGARQLLSAMAQLPSVQEKREHACSLIAKRLQEQFHIYSAIGASDAQGRIWCSSVRPGLDISDRAYFKTAMRSGDFTTGGLVVGRLFGTRTLNFSMPFEDGKGVRAGILVAGLDLDRLGTDLAGARLPAGSSLVIYGPDRRALVHLPERTAVGTDLPAAFRTAFDAQTPGSTETTWLDGSKRLIAFVPPAAMKDAPFLVAVGMDTSVSRTRIEDKARRALLVLAAVVLAALWLAWWFGSTYVRRPVDQLSRAIRAWSTGDLAARVGPLKTGSEFDDLAQAFDAVAEMAEQRRQRLHETLENTNDSVAAIAPTWELTFLNTKAEASLGGAQVLAKSIWGAFPEMIGTPLEDALRTAMEKRQPCTVMYENGNYGGYFQTHISPAEDGGLLIFSRDVTEERRAQENLQYLAWTDPLTDLPNRARALRLAEEADAEGKLSALAIIDLDHFKHVNDSLGHAAGDELLREVSVRLAARANDNVVIARLGGDEFLVLVLKLSSPQCLLVGQELLRALESEPILVRDRLYRMTGSCGLVLREKTLSSSVEDMLANADLALYRSKAAGGAICSIYHAADRALYEAQRELEEDLDAAATSGQFELHYQPKVCLSTGALVGVEALLRWQHPIHGLQAPDAFITVLAESKHALPVGEWIIEAACRQNALWRLAGVELSTAINLFPQQLATADLPERIQAALHRHGLPPEALEIELTENIALAARTEVKVVMERLRASGVRVAFDDFGTGFASLTTLKDLPVDTLKIDRSFVAQLPQGEHDRAIVEAILALARTLNVEVVAEGVETLEQAAYLKARGCHKAQGFLFGKAVPADKLSFPEGTFLSALRALRLT